MAGYSGWGGSPELFDENRGGRWEELRERLRDALSEEDYAAARASTLTAFYTPQAVVDAMWDALEAHGIGEGDAFLEPGCGTGNFIRRAPAGTQAHGVEVDQTSASICRALSPAADVAAAGFEDCYIADESFEAVIGNVPYSGDITIEGMPIHDWFIERSLTALRPGGVACLLTSSFTMDKMSMAARTEIAREAELVAGVRLPSETFRRQAGTDVVSDVLVLRRRPERISEEEALEEPWVRSGQVVVGDLVANVNPWFSERPENVVGDLEVVAGRYGDGTVQVRSGMSADEIGAALAAKLKDQLRAIGDVHDGMAERAAEPMCRPKPRDPNPFELTLDEAGELWWSNGETAEPMEPLGADGAERARAMVALRDSSRALLALEGSPDATEGEVEEGIRGLKRDYDGFVGRFGRLCEQKNRRALNPKAYHDPSLATCLFCLEKMDRNGKFAAEAEMLTRRTIAPAAPMPEHVGTVEEALAVSLAQTGRVNERLMEGLLGIEPGTLLEVAGGAVVRDPIGGGLMAAEDFLSGDLGKRLGDIQRLAIDEPLASDREGFAAAWAEERGYPSRPEAAVDVADELDNLGLWPRESSMVASDVEAQWDKREAWKISQDVDPGRRASPTDWASAAARLKEEGVADENMASRIYRFLAARVSFPFTGRYAYVAKDCGAETMTRALADMVAAAPSAKDLAGVLRSNNLLTGSWEDALAAAERIAGGGEERSRGEDKLADAVRGRGLFGYGVRDASACRMACTELLVRCAAFADEDAMGAAARVAQLAADIRSVDWRAARAAADQIEEEMEQHIVPALMREPAKGFLMDRLLTTTGDMTVNEAVERVSAESFREYADSLAQAREEWRSAHPLDSVTEAKGLAERLREAMPQQVGPEDIAASLGASWIPADTVLEFALDELTRQDATSRAKLRVTHIAYDDSWRVEAAGSAATQAAAGEYGTDDFNPYQLLERSLNGIAPRVSKKNPDTGKPEPDPVGTQAAWEAKTRLEESFRKWVWADDGRKERLVALYNGRMNSIKPRAYDGSALELPGHARGIDLREHQKDAVARATRSTEGTLLAHVVGAGKTYTMAAAAMEARRLGRATKPVIAVPNNLTEQWAGEFLTLYPAAKVLTMGAADTRNRDSVRAFWACARAGDWDAVIVPQSRFEQLRISPERRLAALERRVHELADSLRERDTQRGKKDWSVKHMEAERKKLQTRIESLRARPPLDGICFEDVGFDMLIVDEAHNYKNLAVEGVPVAGMSTSPAMKCEDMLDKCDYLRETGHGGNIIFATGTPISNSMAELFNMERYLCPDVLERTGVRTFSAWAKTYGEKEQAVEPRPEGQGFQVKERFTRFHNLPELIAGFKESADIKTAEDITLDVPDVESHVVRVEATEEQEYEVELLVARAAEVRSHQVLPTEDNMLAITGDGRKIALDPKLLNPDDPLTKPIADGGKVQACADEVARLYNEGAKERTTQLVFCDASTPASGKWNIYQDLKERLVALGVPAEQVGFVTDAGDSAAKKQELFDRVRRGELRILVGSTQKLGTGTNVQDRLIATHDLDCPWRPSDLEQRLGRAQRQGNMHDTVQNYRYITNGTFDSYLYQVVARKQRFISQVFTSKEPQRTVDDSNEIVLTYQEIARLACGDPEVAHRLELQNELEGIKLSQKAWKEGLRAARTRVCGLEPRAEALRREADALAAGSGSIREAVKDAGVAGYTFCGERTSDRPAAAKLLWRAASAVPAGKHERVGSYRGLDVWVEKREIGTVGAPALKVAALAAPGKEPFFLRMAPTVVASANSFNSLDKLIEKMTDGVAAAERAAEEAERDLASAKAAAEKPFEKADRMAQLEAEIAEIDRRIAGEEGGLPGGGETAPTAGEQETDLCDSGDAR